MKRLSVILLMLATLTTGRAQLTWERCQTLARDNYPLIKQYKLVEQSVAYTVSNAAKAHLPQVSLTAQATYQSDVASFPEQMNALYRQIGLTMKGLNRDQYRATLEVSQSLWDGGQVHAQQEIARAGGEVSRQSLEVEMYTLRERVSQIYFGLLSLRAQVRQNDLLRALLESNLQTVGAGVDNGVATLADRQTLEAELLTVAQQRVSIENTETAYRRMLSLMIGQAVDERETLDMPTVRPLPSLSRRPELQLFEAQERHFKTQESAVKSSLLPRVGLFAQGFYGNPGLNLFRDMTEGGWTWNYVAGFRLQWTFGAFYTQKNTLRQLAVERERVAGRRDLFLFQQEQLETKQQAAIDGMRRIMADDDAIIALRTSIRTAAEAKLANGAITVNDLLRDITAESQARMAMALHEIEWLKEYYGLLHTLNGD